MGKRVNVWIGQKNCPSRQEEEWSGWRSRKMREEKDVRQENGSQAREEGEDAVHSSTFSFFVFFEQRTNNEVEEEDFVRFVRMLRERMCWDTKWIPRKRRGGWKRGREEVQDWQWREGDEINNEEVKGRRNTGELQRQQITNYNQLQRGIRRTREKKEKSNAEDSSWEKDLAHSLFQEDVLSVTFRSLLVKESSSVETGLQLPSHFV